MGLISDAYTIDGLTTQYTEIEVKEDGRYLAAPNVGVTEQSNNSLSLFLRNTPPVDFHKLSLA